MSLEWEFPKDPGEQRDYDLNWATHLADETIMASSWEVPAGLTKVSTAFTDTLSKVIVSGGTAGKSYVLRNSIVTDGPQSITRSVRLNVNNR